jgi:hypothetical protein
MLNRSAMATAATLHRSVRLSPLAKRYGIPSLADLISMDVLQATRSDARNDVRKSKALPACGFKSVRCRLQERLRAAQALAAGIASQNRPLANVL